MSFAGAVAAPTRAEAMRAADALAGTGVARVLLFGSVARGDTAEHSDVDLIAIYDDLDYRDRDQRELELTSLAVAAAGRQVDVYVTDRPEWRARTEQMLTSFERNASVEGIVLFERDSGEVNWNKEMTVPISDHDEAVERLADVLKALSALGDSLTPGAVEDLKRGQLGLEDEAFVEYEARLERSCAAGHLTIENAVKALIHLASTPVERASGHDLRRLCAMLVEPYDSEVMSRLDKVGFDNLNGWQAKARYEAAARRSPIRATPELARSITRVACSVADYTAAQFAPSVPVADRINQTVTIIEHVSDTFDQRTGDRINRTRTAPD